jgi:hypothetical protein
LPSGASTATDYLVLAFLGVVVSIGTAGVPGAATVAAATVLSAAGLPLEFVAVTIPISIIADTARTMSNVTAAAVSATVVARQTGLLDDEIFHGRAVFVESPDDAVAAEPEAVPAPEPVPSPVVAAPCGAPAPAPGAPLWNGYPQQVPAQAYAAESDPARSTSLAVRSTQSAHVAASVGALVVAAARRQLASRRPARLRP